VVAVNREVWARHLDKKSQTEQRLFVKWLHDQRELNKYDPKLFEKEQAQVFTLFDRTGVVGFMWASLAILAEGWCFRPELDDKTKAKALQGVQHLLVLKASQNNLPNVLMRPSDKRYTKFIAGYGWKPDEKMFRLYLADLEGPHEDNHQPGS
jgi:hypothetical protein